MFSLLTCSNPLIDGLIKSVALLFHSFFIGIKKKTNIHTNTYVINKYKEITLNYLFLKLAEKINLFQMFQQIHNCLHQ